MILSDTCKLCLYYKCASPQPQPQLASSITMVSDAPNCGVTYDHHYDDRNSFIIQATGSCILNLLTTLTNTCVVSQCVYQFKPPLPKLLRRVWLAYLALNFKPCKSDPVTSLLDHLEGECSTNQAIPASPISQLKIRMFL